MRGAVLICPGDCCTGFHGQGGRIERELIVIVFPPLVDAGGAAVAAGAGDV